VAVYDRQDGVSHDLSVYKPMPPEPSTFALTTPLYYVNDLPHIGSAYTTLAADAMARFQALSGKQVLFITGSDEHGQKIQRTAEARERSPQAHCDEIVDGFIQLWQQLNVQYDRFSRTTAPKHQAIVNEFFQRVWDNGDIYLGQQQGWYCVSCEEFKEERDLFADHVCPIHTNKQAEWRDEQNYFFRLSRYESMLLDYFEQHPNFIQPVIRRNEVVSFVKQGLQDFSISRVNLDWGFPVPTDPHHTLYVWFDALLAYITALLEPEDEPTLNNALARWWPINLHLIGKDILRFHAVYWPAMLLSAGLPLPRQVFGHGFLTKDGQKMGKTLGNTLDPVALVETYGADAVRYYFLKEIEFGRDGDFNEKRFINILNADLANDLGNLLNRTLKMAVKYCDGKIPNASPNAIPIDHPLRSLVEASQDQVISAYNALDFSKACEVALTLVRVGNKFIDEQAPWSLYKQGKQGAVDAVLYAVLEAVRVSAFVLAPITPTLSSKVYQQLGLSLTFRDKVNDGSGVNCFEIQCKWGLLEPLGAMGTPEPIFFKLQPPTIDAPLEGY
jgi:methionyl-tRNA synthetase